MQLQTLIFNQASWYELPPKRNSFVSKIGIVPVSGGYIRCYEDSTGYRWFNDVDMREFAPLDVRFSSGSTENAPKA